MSCVSVAEEVAVQTTVLQAMRAGAPASTRFLLVAVVLVLRVDPVREVQELRWVRPCLAVTAEPVLLVVAAQGGTRVTEALAAQLELRRALVPVVAVVAVRVTAWTLPVVVGLA
jgi:hypothetical protein